MAARSSTFFRLLPLGRHGYARRSDSSAQVLRNSRPEFRLLPLRDSMLFGYCPVAGRRLLPSERIAQHLSEWAQTAAGIHDQNAAPSSAIRFFAASSPPPSLPPPLLVQVNDFVQKFFSFV